MQQILFKNTAVGVMQYDVVVSSTNRESIIVCTYGIYNKNKTTISEKVDNKKLSKKVESIIISLRKKGYKTIEELEEKKTVRRCVVIHDAPSFFH